MAIIDRRGITVDGTPSSAGSSTPHADLAIKTPCRAGTTANITLSGLQTIDGVTVAADDRVLVKDQTDPAENGVYKASSGAWLRTVDVDGLNEIVNGTLVFVTSGSANARVLYYCTATDPITPDTTSMTFTAVRQPTAALSQRVVTAAGAVTVTASDSDIIVIAKTVGAATTVNLPVAATRSLPIRIVDGKYDAATNNITIVPNGTEKIMGGSSYLIDSNGASIILTPLADGSGWI
jgi:phage-related tail fiber protein